MALIVEDGSGVDGANTYADVATVTAYALNRGVILGDDAAVAVQIVKAMDYLSMFSDKWAGYPTSLTQALPFPRKGMRVNCTLYPSNQIHPNLVAALGQLVIEQHKGADLLPIDTKEAFIVREKVDVLETQYSEAVALARLQGAGILPAMPLVDALLAPLMGGGGFSLRTQRV